MVLVGLHPHSGHHFWDDRLTAGVNDCVELDLNFQTEAEGDASDQLYVL
jgi:hypothetical protein